jgi:solute:Na+ symporter, SSS family
MYTITTVDYIVIGFYFLIMLGIGIYLADKSKSSNDYFAGGNKIPWWISGVSLYMTNFSAWIFSGAAGFIYHAGYFAIFYLGLSGFAYWFGGMMTAKLWRRSRVMSPVEYTNTRYNNWTQLLLGFAISMVFILSGGVQLTSIAKLLAAPMEVEVGLIIAVVGLIVIAYTYSGGLWAVNITDFVQFVILIAISVVVLPLSLNLVGGISGLIEALPPITWEHTYRGVYYNEHYVIGILLVTTVGIAAGGAQRFFSVIDEKSAVKVSRMAAVLFLSFPFLFGIPPLVASVYWPDLMAEPFFANKFQPEDLVFLAVVFKVLPLGLVGMFFAALMAATMSALSSVYNIISSIVSRDMYKDTFNPNASDERIFKVGKTTTATVGLIVMALALNFAYNEMGIFNLMTMFFTLLNLPINIPIAFGLMYRKIPRWGGFASIIWGFGAGMIIRFIMAWPFGPQIYYIFIASTVILFTAHYFGEVYKKNKPMLAVYSFVVGIIAFLGFWGPHQVMRAVTPLTDVMMGVLFAACMVLGASVFFFSMLYAKDDESDNKQVDDFFARLRKPVDPALEVYAKGGKETSTFPLVGIITMIVGGLVMLLFLAPIPDTYSNVYLYLSGILILFGFSMYYFGKQTEASQLAKFRKEMEDRGIEVERPV